MLRFQVLMLSVESVQSVLSHSHVWLFVTPWTAAHQASLSITNSRSLPKRMSSESVMPSNHLILCRPLLLPPSLFPSIRVFSNESIHHIRWPKYWSFSFSISPSNEHSGLISSRIDWLDIHSYLPLWASHHHRHHLFLISRCLVSWQDYPSTGFFTHTSQEGFRKAFSEQSSSDSRFKEKHMCHSCWTKSTASLLPDF